MSAALLYLEDAETLAALTDEQDTWNRRQVDLETVVEYREVGDPDCEEDWMRLLTEDEQACAEQHPLMLQSFGKVWLVWVQEIHESRRVPIALAILTEVTVSFRGKLIPTFPRSSSGLHLVARRCLGSQEEEVYARILDRVAEMIGTGEVPMLLTDEISVNSMLYRQIHRLHSNRCTILSPIVVDQRQLIKLEGTAADYWARFSGKTRQTLRRKVRRSGAEIRCFESLESVDEFLELAESVAVNSWQGQSLGLYVSNSWLDRETLKRYARIRAFRSYILMVDETPIAFVLGIQTGESYLYQQVGYDRKYRDRSPGQVLLVHLINDLFERNSPRVLDFGEVSFDYKEYFATTQDERHTLWTVRPGVWGQWIKAAQNLRLAMMHGKRLVVRWTGSLTICDPLRRIRAWLPARGTNRSPVS